MPLLNVVRIPDVTHALEEGIELEPETARQAPINGRAGGVPLWPVSKCAC
jgi:hypothetical protein